MTDAIDLKILSRLQQDCTINLDRLSEEVCLSPTSCYRRIKKMEKNGTIHSRRAMLDERHLGFQVTAVFSIKLEKDSPDIDKRMQRILETRPEILHCYLISGDFDFIMIAKFRDATEYTNYIYHFLETYSDIPIQSYSSKLVVRKIRESWNLPL